MSYNKEKWDETKELIKEMFAKRLEPRVPNTTIYYTNLAGIKMWEEFWREEYNKYNNGR